MKYLGIPALATGMLLSGALPALTITSLVIHAAQEITTPGGIVDLKKGGAAITIEANEGQSLIGKKFRLYQLFSVKNAAHLESVNDTCLSGCPAEGHRETPEQAGKGCDRI